MRYTKQLGFFGLVLVLLVSAQAAVVQQQSFAEFGITGFENADAATENCFSFTVVKDLNQNNPGQYTMVSLHVFFEPVASNDANASFFLNGSEQALDGIKATELRENWWRIRLPNDQLQSENEVRVCLQNSNTSIRSRVEADSFIGTYLMPEFRENDFVQETPSSFIVYNQEFPVTVSLHNSGSESVDVNVSYRKPGVQFKHLPFVKGDSGFVGTLQPDQRISFTYVLKAKRLGSFAIPAASVSFTNIFGEKELLVSNYPIIEVTEPALKVSAVLLNKSTERKPVIGKEIPVQLVVTNNGANDVENIAIVFSNSDGLEMEQRNLSIPLLRAGDTETIELLLHPLVAGELESRCRLVYLDFLEENADAENSTHTSDCRSLPLVVEENAVPIEWIGAGIFLLIALLMLLYYYYRPEPQGGLGA